MKIICQNCGAEVPFGYTKCEKCGSMIEFSANDKSFHKQKFNLFRNINWKFFLVPIIIIILLILLFFPMTTIKIKPYDPMLLERTKEMFKNFETLCWQKNNYGFYRSRSLRITEKEMAVYLTMINSELVRYNAKKNLLKKDQNDQSSEDVESNLKDARKTFTDKDGSRPKRSNKSIKKHPNSIQHTVVFSDVKFGDEYAVRYKENSIEYTTMIPIWVVKLQYSVIIDLEKRCVASIWLGDIPLYFIFKEYAMEYFNLIGKDPIFRFIMDSNNPIKIKKDKMFLIFSSTRGMP